MVDTDKYYAREIISVKGVAFPDSTLQTSAGAGALITVGSGSTLQFTMGPALPASPVEIPGQANGGILTIVYPDTSNATDILELHSSYGIGISVYAHSPSGYQGPQLTFLKSRGTQSAPTVVQNGNALGDIVWCGYSGQGIGGGPTGYAQPCLLQAVAEEDFNSTSSGSYLLFETTAPTTTTLQNSLEIHALYTLLHNKLLFAPDNARDIGAVGNRPASGYFGARLVAGKPAAITPTAGVVTVDSTTGNVFVVSVTAAVTTFQISNPTDGHIVTIIWEQDGAGHTVSGFAANIKGATTPSAGASTVSIQSFVYDGVKTNWYAMAAGVTGM